MKGSIQFTLSFIGGILILAGGILSLLWLLLEFPPAFDPLSELREDMGPQEFKLFQIRFTVAGLSTGIAVVMTSFMLRMRPQEAKRWGVMLIILSAMSILGLGGFFIGMALGIIGGVLSIIREIPLEIVEKEKTAAEPVVEDKNMIFKCSTCDVTFSSGEDLKRHVIKMHI